MVISSTPRVNFEFNAKHTHTHTFGRIPELRHIKTLGFDWSNCSQNIGLNLLPGRAGLLYTYLVVFGQAFGT